MDFKEYTKKQFVEEVLKKLTDQEVKLTLLKMAFEEFVERVDSALLLDEELADAWTDLFDGVVKARKVLDRVDGKK